MKKSQLRQIIKEEIKKSINEGRTYIDPWDKKEYTVGEVDKWISQYRKAYRMSTKDRNHYKEFFKRIGLVPKDYQKVKPKSILNLKRDGGGGYYADGVVDDHNIKVTFEPQIETRGQWCYYWFVNGEEMNSDCLNNFRELTHDLDRQASSYVDEYKKSEHKKY